MIKDRISIGTISCTGNRDINEDSVFQYVSDKYCVIAVADGLGGHGKGDIASQTVVNVLRDLCNDSVAENNLPCIQEIFVHCNALLLAKQKEINSTFDTKTTLTVLVIDTNGIRWGHVGDSRLYAFKNSNLLERTLDHSVPQMLVLSKAIHERKIRNHPDRNRLLKVLGIEWETPLCELSDEHEMTKYNRFLLCSDGFWELINERQMRSCLKKSKSPQEWIDKMTLLVEKSGKNKDMDNYSAVGLWIN